MRAWLILIAVAAAAPAQTFDVAVVKPHPEGGMMGTTVRQGFLPGGKRFVVSGESLKYLLSEAYHLQMRQISGGPSWVDLDRWDLEAKNEESTPVARMRVMLQNLLADRFRLKLQSTAKKMSVYRLTVAPGGSKLTESPSDQPKVVQWGKGRDFAHFDAVLKGFSMDDLADALVVYLGTVSVNETGLEGRYDIPLYYAHDVPGPESRDVASPSRGEQTVFDAVKQLGLRLEKTVGDVQVLNILYVEKPTAN